jgi:hypothetical protein
MMMKPLYAKSAKSVVLILLILLILIHIIPFPVNRELKAVEIKLDDPSYLETRTIHISGTYRFNLFTKDTFNGKIFVPQYELTTKGTSEEVEFSKDPNVGRGFPLSYRYGAAIDTEGRLQENYYFFGRFISKPLMYSPAILVYQKYIDGTGGLSWNGRDGYCIVASADSREEPLEILRKHGIYTPENYR